MNDAPSHDRTGLTEAELGPDPIVRLVAWLDGARAAGVRFPEAAALATADAGGRPAVRHVLIKAIDERGLTFFTNRESARDATWPRTRTPRLRCTGASWTGRCPSPVRRRS